MESVIIIGGGCAGLTAALYTARAELKPLVFTGDLKDKGGLLVKTSIVENYPGFPEGILGYDLIKNMEDQAVKYGARILDEEVVKVDFSEKIKKVYIKDGQEYQAKCVIVATGSKPNKLNLPEENKYWSKGISSCAVCDGALYRRKKVVVVGGGDSSLEEANFLTKFSEVILIHRRDSFRASKAMQNKLFNNKKIKIIYDTVITKFHPNKANENLLGAITIKNLKTENEEILPVDGLFYGLGLTPNTSLFKNILDLDEAGYIIKKDHETEHENEYETATSSLGVFVCGDSSDKIYRQAIVAAGDGCKAALDCNHYLTNFKD